jgi:predicted NAD-dependent protein-ADP-ribosyltransferase YbiA (DUF1768 family)
MVLSKINDSVYIPEFKRVEKADIHKKAKLYKTNIKNVDILIAIGKKITEFEKDNIIYFPIYFLKYNKKVFKIAVFEIPANNSTDYLDEESNFDIHNNDIDPLIFNFVTEEMLEKLRMVPEKLRQEDEEEKEGEGEERKKEIEKERKKEIEKERKKDDEKKRKKGKKDIEENENDEENMELELEPGPQHEPIEKPKKRIEESRSEYKQIQKNFKKTSDSNWVEIYMKNNNYGIERNEGNGDCFFHVLVSAFKSINEKNTSVESLRLKLAKNTTQTQFDNYKKLFDEISTEKNIQKRNLNIQYANFQKYQEDNKDIPKIEKNPLLKNLQTEYNAYEKTKQLLQEYEFMKNVRNLNELKEKMLKNDYWADSFAVAKLQQLLKVKFVILSKDHLNDGQQVLQCENTEEETEFNPQYYIIMSLLGKHYELITYQKKKIFTFSELPYDLIKRIQKECISKGVGLFSLISDFKKMTKKGGGDKSFLNKYNVNDTVFVINANSDPLNPNYSEPFPGKLSGEKIAYNKMLQFLKLSIIPFWRNKLSNYWVQPFLLDNKKWASVEHYCQACKFKTTHPSFYNTFSLDSNTELSKNPFMAKYAGTNGIYEGRVIRPENIIIDINYPKIKKDIKYNAQLAKINQNADLKDLLLKTEDALLVHFQKNREPIIMDELMNIRNKLNDVMNTNNVYNYA